MSSLTWWVRNNTPLSPDAKTPWTLVSVFTIWIVAIILGRPGDVAIDDASVYYFVAAIILMVLGYGFCIYKLFENLFLIIAPQLWWTVRYAKSKRPSSSAIGFVDIVDVFLAYPLAAGLVANVLFERDTTSFTVLPVTQSALIRVIRLTTTVGLAADGIGFTSIAPVGVIAEATVFIVTKVQIFFATILVGAVVSIVQARLRPSETSKRHQRKRGHRRKHRRDTVLPANSSSSSSEDEYEMKKGKH